MYLGGAEVEVVLCRNGLTSESKTGKAPMLVERCIAARGRLGQPMNATTTNVLLDNVREVILWQTDHLGNDTLASGAQSPGIEKLRGNENTGTKVPELMGPSWCVLDPSLS